MPERLRKMKRAMKREYGERGEQIAYATENKRRKREGKAMITRSNPHGRGRR